MNGKVWGEDICIEQTPLREIHKIRVRAGGFCSTHFHSARDNTFIGISGVLEVITEDERSREIAVRLMPGDVVTVPAGIVHRFSAKTDAEAIEIYTPAAVQPGDIERLSEGGINA